MVIWWCLYCRLLGVLMFIVGLLMSCWVLMKCLMWYLDFFRVVLLFLWVLCVIIIMVMKWLSCIMRFIWLWCIVCWWILLKSVNDRLMVCELLWYIGLVNCVLVMWWLLLVFWFFIVWLCLMLFVCVLSGLNRMCWYGRRSLYLMVLSGWLIGYECVDGFGVVGVF